MVNKIEFTNRLKKLLDHYQLTASLFADKIGVQRSSISHILSGRNKPSLDFILKVTNTYSEVDMYWLLNGKGSFPAKVDVRSPPKLNNLPLSQEINLSSKNHSKKLIDRIVIFYNDGTFDEYKK
tara:strand:+ start:65306 stop:65677 length:372 start_codon:yes stop_codon:yes gene_type:complete